MISASHNPFYDNGIKLMNSEGEKMEDEVAHLIECYIDKKFDKLGMPGALDLPYAERENIGKVIDFEEGRARYTGYLISTIPTSFRGLKIALDCANGASWAIAPQVFKTLGADITVIGDEPNGLNTNKGCGSTHIEKLQELVRDGKFDVGFAFDGDADRCLAVGEDGEVIDGDKIMYILGHRLKRHKTLKNDTVVSTIMSNSGFVKALEEAGMKTVQTAVGDRFVYEEMMKNDYWIGGEQSGHIIIRK
jgi:phosphoglucosamine mutase